MSLQLKTPVGQFSSRSRTFRSQISGLQLKDIQEVRTWLGQSSKAVREGRLTQGLSGSRGSRVSPTATASRWPACPMAGSVCAIPRTPPVPCSGSLRVNGKHFSAAHERENSIGSADSVQIGQVLCRPAYARQLLEPTGKAPPHSREGLLTYLLDFTLTLGRSAGARVLAELAGDRGGGAHPPRVDNQFRQALRGHLRQPEHDQRPAVVTGRGEEHLGLAEQQCL